MRKITFITGNEGKVKEAQTILGDQFEIDHIKIDLPEIQAINGKEIIEQNVRDAYAHIQSPVLVDDTSLYFDAWNGLPGALIKWFIDSVGNEGILKMLTGENIRTARAQTSLAYFDGEIVTIATGLAQGTIVEPRGKNGFGWDPIFVPDGSDKTYAEMTDDEKNAISVRKLAWEDLKSKLLDYS